MEAQQSNNNEISKDEKMAYKLNKLKSIEEQITKLDKQMDYIEHKLKILEKVLKGV